MWMPFKGSLLVKSGDVKNLKKLLVSICLPFPKYIWAWFNLFCCFWPFFLPFSILGAGDQPFPYTSIAGSSPPSIPNAFGSSAPWTYYHRGGERKAGQGAQRGGQAHKSISLLHHLYIVQLGCRKHFSLSVFACLTLGVPESWQTAGSVDPALSVPGCSDQDTLYHSIRGISNIQWPLINICENIPI